jgi:hypothetical protein
MKKMFCSFILAVLLTTALFPINSSTKAAVLGRGLAPGQDPIPPGGTVGELVEVCKKILQQAGVDEELVTKASREIEKLLNSWMSKAQGTSAGKVPQHFFRRTYEKLLIELAKRGLRIDARQLRGGLGWALTYAVFSDLFDTILEYIAWDLMDNNYTEEEAQAMSEQLSDLADHVMGQQIPLEHILHGWELINEKRECKYFHLADMKTLVTQEEKGNQDKSRMNRPNSNHGQNCTFYQETTYQNGFLPDGTPTLITTVSGRWVCK